MKKRTFGLAIITGITIAVCAAAIIIWYISYLGKPYEPTAKTRIPTPTPEPDNGINTLILGYAGGTHDGTYLTDTIILFRVDPERKTNYLISIPRDLWVSIPITNPPKEAKINAAYAFGLDNEQFPSRDTRYLGNSGALNLTKDVIAQITGIRIDHTIAIDFSGFSRAINQLGGVDISNPVAFTDEEFPIEGKENDMCGKEEALVKDELKTATSAAIILPCRYETISFNRGLIHLSGEEALKYVRSRHSNQYGSDFSRSQRQRAVLIAVKNKILSMGSVSKIPDVYSTLSSNIRSDLSVTDIGAMIPSLSDWSSYPITTIGLSDDNVLQPVTMPDGQFVLSPLDGILSPFLIRSFLSDRIRPDKAKKAPITALEGTRAQATMLLEFKQILISRGIPVSDILYTDKEATQSSALLVGTMAPTIIETLMNTVPTIKFTTVNTLMPNFDAVITLAPDATYSAQLQ